MALDVVVSAWLAEAWARGLPEEKIVSGLPFRGVSRKEVHRELKRLAASPDADVLSTLAFRIARLEWQARARRRAASVLRPSSAIPRVKRLTKRAFLRDFYAPQRPVVLTGMMRDWKALSRWTPAYFKARFGETPVRVAHGRDETPFYDLNVHAISRTVRFGDFVDHVESTRRGNDAYLVANNDGLRERLPELAKDVGFFGALMDRRRLSGFVYLWYGPGGTVTPLHHDTANILFCQVRGRKKVTLIDPAWTQLVRDCVSFYSFIDLEKPDLKRYPYLTRVPKRTVTLSPGEALFIPAGWWHHVRSLSVSVSVSMTNFTLPNPGDADDPLPGVVDD
ncbi:MAG: cupin-like domain-containing protein [Myxococcota bacterium]